MVESIKKLNKLCQKANYKEKGNWMVRAFLRDAAVPCTWLLLHTNISANQVTVTALFIGILGCGILLRSSALSFLIGTLLLQLWYYLDHVDGQIARYRKTVSLTGRFLDFLMHHMIHAFLIASLGLYVYQTYPKTIFLIVGYLNIFSIIFFNVIHDIKYKTFFEVLLHQQFTTLKAPDAPIEKNERKAISKNLFSLLHKLCEIHVLMNILTLLATFQFYFKLSFDGRTLIFIIYSLIIPLVFITKITHLIKQKTVDKEFNRLFETKA